MTDLVYLVDSIVADLEDSLSLPKHKVWRYVEPPIIRPDLGPMIACYPIITAYEVIGTNSAYEQEDSLAICWYAPTLDAMDTGGTGSQEAAKAALRIAEQILQRLRTYAAGIPGLAAQEEGTIKRVEFEMLTGGYWRAEIIVKVSRWPLT